MSANQKEQNQREWENPNNWNGPRWIAVYSSARDTRWLVPKRVPAMGWTFNFAKPMSWVILFLLVQVMVVAILVASCSGSHGPGS